MKLYLDASALVKLVRREAGSDALQAAVPLGSIATSIVGRIELERVARRYLGEAGPLMADEILAEAVILNLDVATSAVAAIAGPVTLRTLDAIHLASARQLEGELEAFVCYDTQLALAARAAGFRVLSPA